MKDRREGTDAGARRLAPLIELARRATTSAAEGAEARAEKARLLGALSARRAEPPAPLRGRRPLLAALALAAVAILVAVFRPRADLSYAVIGSRLEGGGYVKAPEEGAGAIVRFSEGSELAFEAGSRGRIAEVSPRGASVILESGAARVQVSHLPGADWSVQAGPFRIVVVGTAFDVRWSGAELDVRLHAGSVVVRGPVAAGEITLLPGQRLVARPDGQVWIGAGATLEPNNTKNTKGHAPARDAPAEPPPAQPSEPPKPTTAAGSATSAAEPRPTWSQRVSSGDYKGVLAEADARGIDASLREGSLADLVALGDAARYAGRIDLARRALGMQRSRFRGSAAAIAAAFLLGRLSEDALGQSDAAIAYYDQYLTEAPSGAFAAEALGRKMIALKRKAGVLAARPVAAEYIARFPGGAYAKAAREIAGDP